MSSLFFPPHKNTLSSQLPTFPLSLSLFAHSDFRPDLPPSKTTHSGITLFNLLSTLCHDYEREEMFFVGGYF